MTSRDEVLAESVADPETGCWLWPHGRNGTGYAMVRANGKLQSELLILELFSTRFTPNGADANVYVAYPWATDETTDANTLAGWIDNVTASRSWAYAGMDERVWLEGGDNGATMTTDGIHYSTTGKAECASQWLTALGY